MHSSTFSAFPSSSYHCTASISYSSHLPWTSMSSHFYLTPSAQRAESDHFPPSPPAPLSRSPSPSCSFHTHSVPAQRPDIPSSQRCDLASLHSYRFPAYLPTPAPSQASSAAESAATPPSQPPHTASKDDNMEGVDIDEPDEDEEAFTRRVVMMPRDFDGDMDEWQPEVEWER
ncbi:hypothetical protein JCM1840_003172 [Sporobolomyces johnsonii]